MVGVWVGVGDGAGGQRYDGAMRMPVLAFVLQVVVALASEIGQRRLSVCLCVVVVVGSAINA